MWMNWSVFTMSATRPSVIWHRHSISRCPSNRLIPETQHWVDDIFTKIGVERVERTYDRQNALCCGQVLRAHQREDLADDIQNRNLDDMKKTGAAYCVFNCPVCMATLAEPAAEEGLFPIHLSDLCQAALEADAPKG